MKKNSSNSLIDWRKLLLVTTWKLAPTKAKFTSTASSQDKSTNVWMNGKTLEDVDPFKYLGSTQTKDGASIKEVKIKLAQAYSAVTRLAILWNKKPTNLWGYGKRHAAQLYNLGRYSVKFSIITGNLA